MLAWTVGYVHGDIAKAASEFKKKGKCNVMLWPFVNTSNCPTEKEKALDNCFNMKRLEKMAVPRLVIYKPSEEPAISEKMSKTLSHKVKELCIKFESLIHMQHSLLHPFHTH
ncbi:hypothetical protein QYM36_006916 [Artemia franciscana]|uniref:Uncharacterized protein n=1 Tax=Artemia franciscana TaxID=6661 RepID=A0AA88L4M2_ARTSF|nr:hypothetical protein QYM36_006916 [Artemia franciscana]